MQNLDTAQAASTTAVHANDLGPLAWVLDELRKSLDSATKALRRYVRDAEQARGSDLAAVDSGQLRISRQQLHQAVGALDMVGFAGPATLLRSMENAVQRFVTRPELCTEEAASKIERASFALTGYLETVLAGKNQSAVALFVQYAQVQEVAAATRVHPADLWSYAWRWIEVAPTGVKGTALSAETRALFDKSALMVIKTFDSASAMELAKLSASIAVQEGVVDRQFGIFWRIAAGFFEAIGTGSLPGDLYVKRTVSRILIQLAGHVKGDMTASDRLAQDLLFFCSQAKPQGMAPLLGEVRMAYGLAAHPAVDYTQSLFGQFDPTLLVQARKRISSAKESWSGLVAGEMIKLKPVQDQFSLIVDSITKLLPTGQSLSKALTSVAEDAARTGHAPEPALGMEVATSILFLEAGFEDFDPSDAELTNRINHLAQRIENARQGATNQVLEPWMEDLYRRVSDRQTMGSVVGELKISLAELEKSMDQFFRDPQDKAVLSNVPSRLSQMRGVLSVLGLDHASQAVLRMRDGIEQILVTEVDDVRARAAGTFDKLGNNLGALGFLIDMLSYQPVLAKKLFVFDEINGELKPLMGRVNTPIPLTEEQAPEIVIQAGIQGVAPAAVSASVAVAAMMASAVVAQAAPAKLPPAASLVPEDTFGDDDEMRDIFLEEAREVVGNGKLALSALAADPANLADMTTLRRAFHTLKGSSRMVGLHTFGEAGWSQEQLLNAWLADQKPADEDLRTTASQALAGLEQWIESIAAGQAQAWSAAPFRASADALRLDGKFLALDLEATSIQSAPAFLAPEAALPEASLHAIEPVASSVQTVEVIDFAFDLALPEPKVNSVASVPADVAAQFKSIEASLDEFDLAGADKTSDPVNTSGVNVLDALPEITLLQAEDATTLTVDDQLSKVDLTPLADEVMFDFDLGDELAPVPQAAAAPSSEVAIDEPKALSDPSAFGAINNDFDVRSADIGLDGEDGQVPEVASQETSQELVSADEFAEFERAMLAQDALMDATFVYADDVSPVDAPVEFLPDVVDFTSHATQPMNLSREAVQVDEPAGLGFDLGDFTAPAAQKAVQVLPAEDNASGLSLLSGEDQFKAIGPLRISLPLYNVYINEADEWSRRLVTCMAEWALEADQPLPNDAVVWAHSLAGSSGTVGFSALAGLARTMEHALMHVQSISEDGAYSAHSHANDFVGAAEEIRRLLHQFAAGLLREAEPSVEDSLQRCLRAPESPTQYATVTTAATASGFVDLNPEPHLPTNAADSRFAAAAPTSSAFADLYGGASVTVISAAGAGTVAAPTDSASTASAELDAAFANLNLNDTSAAITDAIPTSQIEVEAVQAPATVNIEPKLEEVAAPAPAPIPVTPIERSTFKPVGLVALGVAAGAGLAVVPRGLTKDETEDEIDLVDAIDPDLFPIFEEEAQELFPQLSGALRQWNEHPSNTSARSEVLRGLHTLKGSARLAGAMRLGELTHRMESEIEHTSQDDATAAQIEPLNALLDGMQANFERLRNPQAAEEIAINSSVATSKADTQTSLGNKAAGATNQPALNVMQPLRAMSSGTVAAPMQRASSNQTVRVRSQLLDRLVNQAGEVMITRSRLEAELGQLRGSLGELTGNLDKLRSQLRDIEMQSESQMQSRMALSKETSAAFDPLEFDRFTRVQELTRMMAESVNDVATVQRSIQRTVESTEDDLVAQARQTRELQRDLLRTRMVEFEGISERLYRVVRQAGKDAGKQVKLDITGGSIEMDRGMLDRMTPAFEHLLRNCVAHGIESAEARTAAGKDASGQIVISLHQEGNDVSVEFRDDGAGLDLLRIRERAQAQGLLTSDKTIDDNETANLIFTPGFTTATQVTELSGRGIGMDVVRSEVAALGGRIETSTSTGKGTSFKLVMPLTTAVTQVVMLRIGNLSIGVPANLVEAVRRATPKELQAGYNTGTFDVAGEALPFFWSGALLQHSSASDAVQGKTIPVLIFRSAAQRIVAHVDEVLGNQEVVVKNLGPQLARLPGLAGMSVLASGAVALIYNPVALATIYGDQARSLSADKAEAHVLAGGVTDVVPRDLSGNAAPVVPLVPANPMSISQPAAPLVLVVDDSITVRRVTQRLLQREGYRVALAADGLLALERLAEELPSVVLSDIEMPRMDGFDLVRNMKADPRLAKLPVITITSRIAEKHREHAMALGVDHYLGKPYSEEELLSLIRRYTTAQVAAV